MYYLWLNEQQVGPFSLDQLQGYLADGSVNADTLYWQEGMADWAPLGTLAALTTPVASADRRIAGFWRRTAAWTVDALVLGIPVLLLSMPLFPFFVALGAFGPLIGFAIALAYFGVLNSAVGRGQTLGKKALGIEVVDRQGAHLPLGRSLLRYAVLAIPYYLDCSLNMLGLSANSPLTLGLGLLVFLWGSAILYLYLFNRRTRQSLHDLAAGSYVVRQAPSGAVSALPVWKGHWIALGTLVAALITVTLVARFILLPQLFANLLDARASILATNEFRSVTVVRGVTYLLNASGKQQVAYYSVTAMVRRAETDRDAAAKKIASIVLTSDSKAAQSDMIVVSVGCGYSLGLASWSYTTNDRYSPAQWQNILSGKPAG